MKTTQIIKKAVCLFISALMLMTSVPTQVFAQKAPITRFRNPLGLFDRMIKDGYTQGYESFAEVYILMPVEDNGNKVLIPVSSKDGWYAIHSGDNADFTSKQWESSLKESPYLPEGYVMKEHKIVHLNKSLKVRDGSSLPAGTYLDMTDDFFTVCTRDQLEKEFIAIEKDMADKIIPDLSVDKLSAIFSFDKTGKFVGPVETVAPYARVQAVQDKAGVYKLSTAGEDREMEALLLHQGVFIKYAPDIHVFDEKVSNQDNFQRQRMRWMTAQIQSLFSQLPKVPKALLHGNINFVDKVIQQALIPRSILIVLLGGISIIMTLLVPEWCEKWWILFGLLGIALFIAIPAQLRIRSFAKVFAIPGLVLRMFKNMLHIDHKNTDFIHTEHNA